MSTSGSKSNEHMAHFLVDIYSLYFSDHIVAIKTIFQNMFYISPDYTLPGNFL